MARRRGFAAWAAAIVLTALAAHTHFARPRNGAAPSRRATPRQPETSVVGGIVESGLELVLPLELFGLQLNFELQDGAMRLTYQEDGTVTGVLAGGVPVQDILTVASEENVDPELVGLMEVLLASTADLAPDEDGTCTQISFTMTFETIPVFFFDETTPADD